MPDQPPSAPFRRALTILEHVTVSVDGLAPLDPHLSHEPPSRVLLTMRDAEAHHLAHLIARTVHAAEALASPMGGVVDIGAPEQELADALHEAATWMGYHCCEDNPDD